MKRQLFAFVFASFMIGSFFGIGVAAAQGVSTVDAPTQETASATPPPETPTARATVEPTKQPGGNPLNTDNAISVASLLYGLIIAVLGGGTVAVILNRFGSNKTNQDAAEKLYKSLSPEAQENIRQMFESLRDVTLRVIDLADKVTDGQPNGDVVAQVTQVMQSPQMKAHIDAQVTAQVPPAVDKALDAKR